MMYILNDRRRMSVQQKKKQNARREREGGEREREKKEKDMYVKGRKYLADQ